MDKEAEKIWKKERGSNMIKIYCMKLSNNKNIIFFKKRKRKEKDLGGSTRSDPGASRSTVP